MATAEQVAQERPESSEAQEQSLREAAGADPNPNLLTPLTLNPLPRQVATAEQAAQERLGKIQVLNS